ncbi:MAG: hypothetical protein JWL81_2577, partial [Verrucomicrobiales bacterium]|nr:hypothetical protein [Verrucomicrobiales bacterium]
GYSFILLVFAGALALTAGVVAMLVLAPNFLTLKIAVVVGATTGGLSWAILKAVWIRLEAPTGLRLDRENAPALMDLLESMRTRLNAAAFHRVLLTPEYNASVCQVPLLGMFGWHRNYLSLGLPLLQSLSAPEFEGVLAHECAHLARGHAGLGNWLYRMRRSWQQLIHQLQRQQNGGGRVFSKFLHWFWPRFNAHAFVNSRANEYEADAVAAQLVGPERMATALTRVAVYGRHLNEGFWAPVMRRVQHEPAPPGNIFQEMQSVLKRGPGLDLESRWMHRAFLVNTDNDDTHPCLRERLENLGGRPDGAVDSRLPPLTGPSAAEHYLGGHGDALISRLAKEWADLVQAGWAREHAETKAIADRLTAEGGAEVRGPAPVDVLWSKAEAVMRLGGPGAAQELIDEILIRELTHADALFSRGAWRLSQDDGGGVRDVERAMEYDPEWKHAGLQSLGAYYHRHGMGAELKDVRQRFETFLSTQGEVLQERSGVALNDPLKAHGLSQGQLEDFQRILAAEPVIAAAWCAQKVLRLSRKGHLHVLCVEVKVPFWRLRTDGADQAMIQRLSRALPFPDECVVFVRKKDLIHLGDKIKRMADSRVYRREGGG